MTPENSQSITLTGLSAGRPSRRTDAHVQPAAAAMRETVRLNVDIDAAEYKAIKLLALQQNTTISHIAKQALTAYRIAAA